MPFLYFNDLYISVVTSQQETFLWNGHRQGLDWKWGEKQPMFKEKAQKNFWKPEQWLVKTPLKSCDELEANYKEMNDPRLLHNIWLWWSLGHCHCCWFAHSVCVSFCLFRLQQQRAEAVSPQYLLQVSPGMRMEGDPTAPREERFMRCSTCQRVSALWQVRRELQESQ